MLKSQIYLVAGASILVLGLFALPKVVVKNPSGMASQEALNTKKLDKEEEMHAKDISEEQKSDCRS